MLYRGSEKKVCGKFSSVPFSTNLESFCTDDSRSLELTGTSTYAYFVDFLNDLSERCSVQNPVQNSLISLPKHHTIQKVSKLRSEVVLISSR